MTVGISRSHTGPTHGQQRKRGLTDEGNTERHGESAGAVVSRTEPCAAGANAKSDVRVCDRETVSRAEASRMHRHRHGDFGEWIATGLAIALGFMLLRFFAGLGLLAAMFVWYVSEKSKP